MLVSPYLYNYDFLLLLVPFAVLFHKSNLVQKILVFICYLIPTFALLIYGRNGNITLNIATAVLLLLVLARAKNPIIDVPAHATYNTYN